MPWICAAQYSGRPASAATKHLECGFPMILCAVSVTYTLNLEDNFFFKKHLKYIMNILCWLLPEIIQGILDLINMLCHSFSLFKAFLNVVLRKLAIKGRFLLGSAGLPFYR